MNLQTTFKNSLFQHANSPDINRSSLFTWCQCMLKCTLFTGFCLHYEQLFVKGSFEAS